MIGLIIGIVAYLAFCAAKRIVRIIRYYQQIRKPPFRGFYQTRLNAVVSAWRLSRAVL